MFRGASSLNLDAKGRLAIPAKHRDALHTQSAGHLVLTAHPHGCLLLYPQVAWEPIQAKMMSLSSFDKRSSALQRLLVGYAEDIEMDAAGRLLVSPVLREFAGLEKNTDKLHRGNTRLFVGYTQWGEGGTDLAKEIENGDWILSDITTEEVMTVPTYDLWKYMMEKSGNRKLLALPADPMLN